MNKRSNPEALALAEEARVIFSELRAKDDKTWSNAQIARTINSVTGRHMDSGSARRFLMPEPDRITVFSLLEANNILKAAKIAQIEYQNALEGNQELPSIRADFIQSVSLQIEVPVSKELFEKMQDNPALKEFIEDTVRNTLSFIDKTISRSPH